MCYNLNKDVLAKTDFKNAKTIIIAISGGSDSVALLLLLKRLFAGDNNVNLVAVTIDHKLRSESSLEALWVKELCQRNEIKHKIINWEDHPQKGNLSAAARFYRYKLLYNYAQKFDNAVIVTAHNLNDRIENFYMRKQRQSNKGLASIAKYNLLYGDIYLIRPLLNYSKEQLRNYLIQSQQNWLEDPTNKNLKYERARIRQILGPLTPEQLKKWQIKLNELDKLRYKLSELHCNILKEIDFKFDLELLQCNFNINLYHKYGTKNISYILGLLASIIGGAEYIPNDKQLRLLQNLPNNQSINLCRAIIRQKKQQENINWRFYRENRNIKQDICPANSAIIWDKRYKITNYSQEDLILRPILKTELQQISHKGVKAYYHRTNLVIQKQQGEKIIAFNDVKNLHNKQRIFYPTKDIAINITNHIEIYKWLVSGFELTIYELIKTIFP